MSYPNVIRSLQALGLTSSAFLSGGTCFLSLLAVPALQLQPPAVPEKTNDNNDNKNALPSPTAFRARQFTRMYYLGAQTGPPLSAVSTAISGYLAYAFYSRGTTLKDAGLAVRHPGWYVASAVLTIAIVPWTIALMARTNNALIAGGGKEDGQPGSIGPDALNGLLDRWGWLNIGRAMLPLAGTVAAWIAIF